MRYAHKLHIKLTNLQPFVSVFVHHDGAQFKPIGHWQAKVCKYFLHTTNGELASINRRWELWHNVRQPTYVVKVAVRDDVGAQLVADRFHVRRVGDAIIDTR